MLPRLLEFVFILIIFYYLFKLLVRYLFPWIVKRYLKYFQNKFYEQNPQARPKQSKDEGKVKVDYEPKQDSKSDNIGEYVDYEEVDD